MPDEQRDLAVVVLNYNTRECLRDCFETLQPAIAGLAADVFFVDNCSSDGSFDYVRQNFPYVKSISAPENEGYLREGAKVAALDLSWQPNNVSNDADASWMDSLRQRTDVLCQTVDITKEDQVRSAFDATIDRFGTVDVLCNNAGMRQRNLFPPGRPMTVLEATNDDFRKMYDVTLFGTLTVTRQFVKPMLERRGGSILTSCSSGLLIRANPGAYSYLRPWSREQPYTSAKAALANTMAYLGDELQEYNIAVNCFLPGHTRSSGFEEQAAVRRSPVSADYAGPAPFHPDHVQLLGIFLAQQDAKSGNTAKLWDTTTWLLEHGYGPLDRWRCPGGDIWATNAPGSWSSAMGG